MLGTFEDVLARFRPAGLRAAVRRVSYYDLVLGVIPLVFVVSALVGRALSVPTRTAITVAAVLAALAVCDALFVNPPGGGA